MDLGHKLLAGSAGLLLVGGISAGAAWLGAREDRIRAEAKISALEDTRAEIRKQQDQLAETVKQMHEDQQRQMEALDRRFAQATSPQQVAQLAAQLMGLKQPIQFVTPAATPENPHPQPVAQVSVSDMPQVKDYLQECESCKVKLETAVKDLTFSEQRHELDNANLKAVEGERDTWKKAARGGSFWQRIKRNGKWLLIGAAGGAIAATAARR